MILSSNGQNIYPEEIEDKLNNMPYISESIVIEKEGKLVALIYPDFDLVNEEKITDEKLDELMTANLKEINQQLPAYCIQSACPRTNPRGRVRENPETEY